MNILIIDNIKLNQVYIEDILKNTKHSQPIKTFYSDTEKESIDIINKHHIHILLLDFSDGPIDSFKLVKKIRDKNPNIYIVFLSFYSDHNSIIKAMRKGVNDYLIKPLKPVELTQAINIAIENLSDTGEADSEVPNDSVEKVDFIEEALDFIKSNYNQDIDLEMVANEVFVNPQYFSKVFKRTIGITFSEYVNKLRINHACYLLLTTDWPINNIALEIGFNNVSYFNRVFKQTMDLTPCQYKNKKLKNNLDGDSKLYKLRSM